MDGKDNIRRTLGDLRATVRRHPLLKHPFLERARTADIDISDLRTFATQEMFVSAAFPALLAEVISRIPYTFEEIRYPLIVNMFEEAGERDPTKSHSKLLRTLAESLGVSKQQLSTAQPFPETTEYLSRLFSICRRSSHVEGLAAIGYGNEYLVLFEYPLLRRACDQLGHPPGVLEFFDVNIQADVDHTNNIEAVLALSLDQLQKSPCIRQAVKEALDARVTFYDGINRHNYS